MKTRFHLTALVLASSLIAACSGGSNGGGSGTTSGLGNMSLYITDDISNFKQVRTTLNKIQLVNTGTGASCDVVTTSTTYNITNLAGIMHLINTASCPTDSFNRIRIEFDKNVTITNAAGTSSVCSFASYKDENNATNMLNCQGNNCSIDINGAVKVLANQENKAALDFNLKDFEVEQFGQPNCSVTMKVSPLNASEIEQKKENEHAREAVTGAIFGLSTSLNTFTVQKGKKSFNVDYSIATGILTGKQQVPPIDTRGTGIPNLSINAATRSVSGTVIFSNLTGNAFAAHIHQGAVGVNGPVIIPLAGGTGSKSGVFSLHTTLLTQSQFDALRTEQLYLNIHSEKYPDGEIRGQMIYPTQTRIDRLLQFAADNNLKTRIFCAGSISDKNTCYATSLVIKLDGTISKLDAGNHTFTLSFKGKQITVDYTQAFIDGKADNLSNNDKVEVNLFGIADNGNYLASQVAKNDDETECED